MEIELGFVDREEEKGSIRQALHGASSGRGAMCLLEGVTGIGKSRLLSESRRMAESDGFVAHHARCSPLERMFPFGVSRQLFESLAVEVPELMTGSAGQAAGVLGGPEPGAATPPESELAVLHGLYWFTVNACQRQRRVLLIDDVQYADSGSLRYLLYLLPRLVNLPLCVVVTFRPVNDGGAELLDYVVSSPEVIRIPLAPMSPPGAAEMLSMVLSRSGMARPDSVFTEACVEITGGNPLLLNELAITLKQEKIRPTGPNAELVRSLVPDSISRHFGFRLDQLPRDAVQLAEAVTVLGKDASVEFAAAIAGLPLAAAVAAIHVLEKDDILRGHVGGRSSKEPLGSASLEFVHPMIGTLVYERMDYERRAASHRLVVRLLSQAGERIEKAAMHLLRVPPEGDEDVVELLRAAAAAALSHGSPAEGYRYLRRCLLEPPRPDQLPAIELAAGIAAFAVDLEAAITMLRAVLKKLADPRRQAEVSYLLALAMLQTQRSDEAADVLISALSRLPVAGGELAGRLRALLVAVPLMDPDRSDLAGFALPLRRLPADDTVGGRMLDCVIAEHEARQNNPDAVPRALRALSSNVLIREPDVELPVSYGWSTLLAADDDAVVPSLDAALAQAHRAGSLRGSAVARTFRGAAYLLRGRLEEARRDITDAFREIDSSGVSNLRPMAAWVMVQVRLAQAQIPEGRVALDWADMPEPMPRWDSSNYILAARAMVAAAAGEHVEALGYALELGRRTGAAGMENAALLPWRSFVVRSLHELGRASEARGYASVELVLARRWGAPSTLGRALRTAAMVAAPDRGLELLQESSTVLSRSSARLEQAATALALGRACVQAGDTAKAITQLRQGYQIAEQIGAIGLAEACSTQLRAVGVRPNRNADSRQESLTASEQRIAELAATGYSNRAIAQQQFLSIKTVELHLRNAYRKLGIRSRTELPSVFGRNVGE